MTSPSEGRPAGPGVDGVAFERDIEETSRRLLASAGTLSFDPATEVDWDAPLGDTLHGLNPQWSTLYGTPLWEEMTERQRVTLTRHEVASIMSTGIWFEMILQQMILRDHYATDRTSAEFRFALTEIADECRHSDMFARACATLGATGYMPRPYAMRLGRVFKSIAAGEVAYAGMLVAEEVLDVMQRDWMRGEDVLPLVRQTSRIHVVEESRHMAYARQEVREAVAGLSPRRRAVQATVIALAADVIVSNLVDERVYARAGLDVARAVEAARGNAHHRALMRSSCRHLMDFLAEVDLLPRTAVKVYQRTGMI